MNITQIRKAIRALNWIRNDIEGATPGEFEGWDHRDSSNPRCKSARYQLCTILPDRYFVGAERAAA